MWFYKRNINLKQLKVKRKNVRIKCKKITSTKDQLFGRIPSEVGLNFTILDYKIKIKCKLVKTEVTI